MEAELLRDCRAVLCPSGESVILLKGSKIFSAKIASGGCEVLGLFGAALIAKGDMGALSSFSAHSEDGLCGKVSQNAPKAFDAPTEDDLREAAKLVFDPEIPVNVVDLGLVYRLEVLKRDDGKYCAEADMTLTAPGCVLGPMIAEDLRMRLESLPNIEEAKVNVVWDPPWNSDMISEEGKMALGLI